MLPRSTTCSMSCAATSAFVRPRVAVAGSAPSLATAGFRPPHPASAAHGVAAPPRACASSSSIETTGPIRVPSCSALRRAAHLLWPRLTSPAPSPCLSASVALSGRTGDLPGYRALTFTLMPVGSTSQRSVQVPGFDDMGRLTPLPRLYPLPVRQANALPSASFRFAVTRDTLAVRLTVPLAGSVEDFHLQVSAPCRAHPKKRRQTALAPLPLFISLTLPAAGLLPQRRRNPEGPCAA
jgi:hypothetical protein